jgi:sulfur-carrier protein adenylyltransferase/sulfurtransferase
MVWGDDDPLREVRGQVPEMAPAEVVALTVGPGLAIVDLREAPEWDAGHVPGAVHVPWSRLEQDIEQGVPDRDARVVLYCAVGIRSVFAGLALRERGYADVASMAGGFERWLGEGLPRTNPNGLADDQLARYARQIRIPEIGPGGQARLLGARVLVVGAGGLGSPAALYLAAAGVGTLRIVDFDVVDLSNLQRQVLHSTERLGQLKVESAEATLRALNPDVRIELHPVPLGADNAADLMAGCDAILDATDSFDTRYALNDAAVAAGIPLVHASVFRFEGQLSTFVPGAGPCYRCLHPVPPPPDLAPACSLAGVLGVVPGVMGVLQANEVLKLILGIGEPLVGRLLLFDALDATFIEVRVRRDPACPACGEAALATGAAAPQAPAETAAPE